MLTFAPPPSSPGTRLGEYGNCSLSKRTCRSRYLGPRRKPIRRRLVLGIAHRFARAISKSRAPRFWGMGVASIDRERLQVAGAAARSPQRGVTLRAFNATQLGPVAAATCLQDR